MKFSDIFTTIGLGSGTTTHIPMLNQQMYNGTNVDRIFHHGAFKHPFFHHQKPNIKHHNIETISHGYYYPSSSGFGYSSPGYMKFGATNDHSQVSSPAHSGYGGYGVHESSGSGYAAPPMHHHMSQPSLHPRSTKSKGKSTLTALTLLSFFFFLNLLQNCLKEHMDAMNPTVMVMTSGVARNRLKKLTESKESINNYHNDEQNYNTANDNNGNSLVLGTMDNSHDQNFFEYSREVLNDNKKFNITRYSPSDIDRDHIRIGGKFDKINTKLVSNKNDFFKENNEDKTYLRIQ